MFDSGKSHFYSVSYYELRSGHGIWVVNSRGPERSVDWKKRRLEEEKTGRREDWKKPHRRNSDWRHLISATLLRFFQIDRWLTVISFFMPLILCLTVISSVGIGVLSAYVVVIGILDVCGRASQAPMAARPRLVLMPTQHHGSGD